MGKLVTDYLDEYSQAMVGHKGWEYLDCMTTEEQLDVIQNYNHREADHKYIIVVFERNKENNKNYELMDNGEYIDHSDCGPRTEEMEE